MPRSGPGYLSASQSHQNITFENNNKTLNEMTSVQETVQENKNDLEKEIIDK